MSVLGRDGDLEIDQDLTFQRREWLVQRVLWVVCALVIVLGVIGLFGGGPISSVKHASGDDTVAVEYHRFVRHDGRASLTFRVDASHASGQEVEVWIDQRFLDRVQIENVSPQPASVRSDDDRMTWVFETGDGSDALIATFAYRPQAIGRIRGEAGSGTSTVDVGQLAYP